MGCTVVAFLSSIKICENLNFSGCAVEKFKFSQILMDDKNATYLCSRIITTLKTYTLFIPNMYLVNPILCDNFVLDNLNSLNWFSIESSSFISNFQMDTLYFTTAQLSAAATAGRCKRTWEGKQLVPKFQCSHFSSRRLDILVCGKKKNLLQRQRKKMIG